MLLEEYLQGLTTDELNNISRNLHCIEQMDKFAKWKYIQLIKDRVMNELICFITGEDSGMKLSKTTISDLKRKCFGLNAECRDSIINLKKYGIISRDELVHDDIRKMLVNIWRRDYIAVLDDYKISITPTLMLKTILIIYVIENRYILTYNELINSPILNKDEINLLIRYFGKQNLIFFDKNWVVHLNYEVLNSWRHNKENALGEFYNFCFGESKDKLDKLIALILTIQKDSNQWVNMNKCHYIKNDYNNEIIKLKRLRCILEVEKDGDKYIQLHPEIWYLKTNMKHKLWENNERVITPDFEAFIPFFYDPFTIDMFLNYGLLTNYIKALPQKKNKRKTSRNKTENRDKNQSGYDIDYVEDYYFIFNIEKGNTKNNSKNPYMYKEFINVLGENIPDIVKYELNVL